MALDDEVSSWLLAQWAPENVPAWGLVLFWPVFPRDGVWVLQPHH